MNGGGSSNVEIVPEDDILKQYPLELALTEEVNSTRQLVIGLFAGYAEKNAIELPEGYADYSDYFEDMSFVITDKTQDSAWTI